MMRVFFLRDHEQYIGGREYFIERTLAIRLEAKGVLETWPAHVERLEDEAAAKVEKKKALDAKAKKLKAEKSKEKETATSKKESKKEKAVK